MRLLLYYILLLSLTLPIISKQKFYVNPIYFDTLKEREYKSDYELQYNEWLNSEYGLNKTNFKTKLDRDTNLAKGAYTYGLLISSINPIKAKRWIDSVVVYSKRANWKRGIISSYNGYGFIYANLGDIVSSNYYFKKAIEFGEGERSNPKSNIIDKLGWTYIYYGNMLINIGDSSKAFKQYYKAREIFYRIKKDPEGVGYALLKRSIQNISKLEFDKANMYLDSAYNIFEYEVPKDKDFVNRHERGIAEVYLFKASILKYNKEYIKALQLLDSSIHLIKLYHVRNILIQAMLEKSGLEITINKTRNTLKGINYCIDLAIETKMYKELALSYKVKSDYYKSIGNNDKAYEYLVNYMKLKETIMNDDKIKSIAKIESDVENEVKIFNVNIEKNKKEMELKKEQDDKIKLVLVVVFVVLLLLGSVYFVLKLRKSNQELVKSEEVIFNLNLKQSQYYAVLSHDIRSPLNTINSNLEDLVTNKTLSEKERISTINELSSALNNLKKHIEYLFEIAKSNISVKNEIKENINLEFEVKEILNLYKPNIDSKGLTLEYEINSQNLNIDKSYLDTILRNFINNAIKYSKRDSVIKFTSNDKEIALSNNIDNEELDTQKGYGFGIKICKDLATQHNHIIEIDNTDDIYKITLKLDKS